MRALIQRVASARVDVGGQTVGAIGPGLLVFAGFEADDGEAELAWLSAKLCKLRIFDDAAGVMNCSLVDSGGELLAVSQFTLFASLKKGSRPSWGRAARPEIAAPLFDRFVAQLERDLGRRVPTGVFGADMQVHLINDGPVTIAIDTRDPQ